MKEAFNRTPQCMNQLIRNSVAVRLIPIRAACRPTTIRTSNISLIAIRLRVIGLVSDSTISLITVLLVIQTLVTNTPVCLVAILLGVERLISDGSICLVPVSLGTVRLAVDRSIRLTAVVVELRLSEQR